MDKAIKLREMKKKDKHVLECTEEYCGHIGRPFIKMGGLICAKCRVILKFPNSPEWKAFYKDQKES